MNSKLSIHKPDSSHNWGIQFESENENEIRKFVKLCKTSLDKRLMPFHQSGLKPNGELANYQYFEFFGVNDESNIDLMINECLKIAEMMGVELEI